MAGSHKRGAARSWSSWPVLRLIRNWLGIDETTAPGWDTPTVASADRAGDGPLCVLVVDDSSFNRRLVYEMLLACGVRPLLAADGAEAVKLAREVRLDLILMDLQMPVLDGRSATRQVRQEERSLKRARVPIVTYSAMPLSQHTLRDAGFDGALDKPCDLHALRACLLRWCPSGSFIGSSPEAISRQAPQDGLHDQVGMARRRGGKTGRP